MWTKGLPRGSCPHVVHSATTVIEFTATFGVVSVKGPVFPTPKTLVGIHTVFGEKRVSPVYYMVWEKLGPSFFL